MSIVLRGLDKERFKKNIVIWLNVDNIIQNCYTNFKDIVADAIIQMISEIVEKDNWNLQYFDEKELQELFNAFMKNSKIMIQLNKQIDELNYAFEEVIVEFDFPEEEKKRIVKRYIDNILEAYGYLDLCIFVNLEEINVDTISEALSNEVYGLLSSEEIKAEFKDKIEDAIKIINDENVIDDIDVSDVDVEEE